MLVTRPFPMLTWREWVRDMQSDPKAARFLKMTPSSTPEDAIYDVAALPKLRLLMPEDWAWSRLEPCASGRI